MIPMFRSRFLPVVFLLSLFIMMYPVPAALPDVADIVLLNGSIYTVKPGTDWQSSAQEAIALKGDTILSVNSTPAIKAFIGPHTTVYDLGGKMVLPGFIDTHIHVGGAAQLQAGVDITSCSSVADIMDRIRLYSETHPDEQVIRGFGWNYFQFNESGPDKGMIDAVIGDTPVILTSFDGHTSWVNTKALNVAGVDRSTPDPDGGKIVRDSQGNPSGVLREMAATNLVTTALPSIPLSQIKEQIAKLLPELAATGITTVDDALVTPDMAAAYAELEKEDSLPVRIFGEMIVIPELGADEIPVLQLARALAPPVPDQINGTSGYHDDLLQAVTGDPAYHITPANISEYFDSKGLFRLQTAKLFVDGVIESHTAYLLTPYADQPSVTGTVTWNRSDFTDVIEALDDERFQIDIHAIGDGAVRMCLDAYENAKEKNGVRDSRHKISHIQLINQSDIPRLSSLGIIAALQPVWFYRDQNYENTSLPYLGQERAGHMLPLASIQKQGGIVAFGTDYPVGSDYQTFNPLDGIRTAVTRLPLPPHSTVTTPYRPDERVALRTAIANATYTGAYTNFIENQTGSLEEGKMADLVILDKDIFTLPPNEINKAHVVATFLEGKIVYQSNTSFSSVT